MLPVHHSLKTEKCIGLIAPAGFINKDQIEKSVALLEGKGFKIKLAPHLFGRFRFYSGSVRDRIADIHRFLEDPEVSILFAVRGGAGSSQLLTEINFRKWNNSKKLLVGFSDVTALQWALLKKTGLGSISGPTLISQFHEKNPYINLFLEMLTGKRVSIDCADLETEKVRIVRNGTAKGVLIGGTLSIINTLLGTPYFPELNEVVLFLEDVNEPIYKIERSLVQLKLAGFLNKVSGLILGKFLHNGDILNIWSEIEYLFPRNIPVVLDFPYGHFMEMCPLPVGVQGELETNPIRIRWKL